MTIQLQGHVLKMESGQNVRLTLYMESRAEPIIFDATFAEIGTLYLPGTVVQVTIVPVPPTAKGEPRG
jgi:hypothetical protein